MRPPCSASQQSFVLLAEPLLGRAFTVPWHEMIQFCQCYLNFPFIGRLLYSWSTPRMLLIVIFCSSLMFVFVEDQSSGFGNVSWCLLIMAFLLHSEPPYSSLISRLCSRASHHYSTACKIDLRPAERSLKFVEWSRLYGPQYLFSRYWFLQVWS